MDAITSTLLRRFLVFAVLLSLAACTEDSTRPRIDPPPLVIDAVPSYTYRVVNQFPHDPNAFTQGLVFRDGFLFESTGKYGQSSIRRVDLPTGDVLQARQLPADRFGEGMTLYGERIVQLTYVSHTGYVYEVDTFDPIGQFQYPTQGWGLTHDGERLIMSDGSDKLFFLDPYSFVRDREVSVKDGDDPVYYLNELEYIDGRIFANIWRYDLIAVIDPGTGSVTNWIDLDGLLPAEDATPTTDVLNGIAFDEVRRRLFVTGKNWPWLFEIELVPVDADGE